MKPAWVTRVPPKRRARHIEDISAGLAGASVGAGDRQGVGACRGDHGVLSGW